MKEKTKANKALADAKRYAKHYFSMPFRDHPVTWDNDNNGEVEELVTCIVEAAKGFAKLAIEEQQDEIEQLAKDRYAAAAEARRAKDALTNIERMTQAEVLIWPPGEEPRENAFAKEILEMARLGLGKYDNDDDL